MRNILAFLAAVVITIGVAGKYLGWYTFRSTTDQTGHRNVNIDFDTKKIGVDLQKGAAGVQKALDKHNEAVADKPADKLEKPENLLAPPPNLLIPPVTGKIELPRLPELPVDPTPKNGAKVSVEIPPYRAFEN